MATAAAEAAGRAGAGSFKKQKYDRQLRIWGESGQAALESANICLINGGALGTETLKNLVLPGIGCVSVVDSHRVTPADLGNNFFVTEESLGASRAMVVAKLLQELNEDVRTKFFDAEPAELLEKNPEFFDGFTTVIATQLSEPVLKKLARRCWARSVPLIATDVCGFIGTIRIVMPELCIVESKPDSAHEDLRITSPFPALAELEKSFDLDTEDSAAHAHIPWIIILMKCLAEWRAKEGQPDGKPPLSGFRSYIRSRANNHTEENFEEAARNARYARLDNEVPSTVRAVLEDPCCSNISESSSEFWIVMRALREFVAAHGALPLVGSIPDMTSDTASYVALQRAYQAQANADAEELVGIIARGGIGDISADYIKLVCKNAHNLRVKRFSSLDHDSSKSIAAELSNAAMSAAYDPARAANTMWYLGLRAADMFALKYSRKPGMFPQGAATTDPAEDVEALTAELHALLSSASCLELLVGDLADKAEKVLGEICRCGGAELHPTAALVGGMASQEIIKVLSAQFVPTDGVFVVNLMDGSATKLAI